MKIGTLKVKRNYTILQMVLDAVALLICYATVQCVFSFGDFIDTMNDRITSSNSEVTGLVVWQWNIVWVVISALVVVISLLMIYLPRKMPKKYVINETNAQKYSDIVITAITCLRIPALLAVFEGMCIHQNILTSAYDRIITPQIPFDIILSVVIIYFAVKSIKKIQPNNNEEKQ